MATGDPGHNPHAFTAHERAHSLPRRRSKRTANQKSADRLLKTESASYARESKRRIRKAAPLLLAALQGLNHMGGDDRGGYCICPCNDGSAPSHKHSSACRDARIAIAAATGESANGLEF